jgi:hypothetical protein
VGESVTVSALLLWFSTYAGSATDHAPTLCSRFHAGYLNELRFFACFACAARRRYRHHGLVRLGLPLTVGDAVGAISCAALLLVKRNSGITHVDGYALWVDEGSRNVTMDRLFVSDIGAGGVRIGKGISGVSGDARADNVSLTNSVLEDGGA